MAIATFTQAYNHAYAATTRDNSSAFIHDQVWYKHPLMFWLEKIGNAHGQTADGGGLGGNIERRLETLRNDGSQTWSRGTTFQRTDPETLRVAVYTWGQNGISLTRYYEDEMRNSGREQIIKLVTHNIKNTTKSLRYNVAQQIAASGSPNTDELNGLQHFVREDPTASVTVGGINQSTDAFWRNQYYDMAADAAATYLDKRLMDMSLDIGKWGSVDYIIGGPTAFSLYNDVTLDQKIIMDKRMGDAQFLNTAWKGIPLVVDYDLPTDSLFLLDSSEWEYLRDPRAYFKWTDWKELPDGLDMVGQLIMRAQVICDKRLSQGVLFNINASGT